MRVCRVIGQVVATAKHPILEGLKIMVVRGIEGKSDPQVPMQLALDAVGAGVGSEVLVTESGGGGQELTGVEYPAVRSVIVGIVD